MKKLERHKIVYLGGSPGSNVLLFGEQNGQAHVMITSKKIGKPIKLVVKEAERLWPKLFFTGAIMPIDVWNDIVGSGENPLLILADQLQQVYGT